MSFFPGRCRVPSRAHQVQESIERYVAEINADPSILQSRGDFSKYVLEGEDRKGTLELTWVTKGEDGIACNLESEGADALNEATAAVRSLVARRRHPALYARLNHKLLKVRRSISLDSTTVEFGGSRILSL